MPTSREIANAPAEVVFLIALIADVPTQCVSLPWLAKRLDLRASQVLRLLAPLGQAGAGWLDVAVQDDQWQIGLTPAGLAQLGAQPSTD
ncbi:MarR family transcriptional regulator [Achromobacter sp. GG226]|uniref:MarR family transcriptional regulator n=1 Tax=Verticiella alkaliphila TaxID=2779529 RepID=UPI001C0D85FA|nr:MarR family transcriptional regulator [Verticiella sp. GG226]MBU4612950.1 MarR family transcriptional regulator [Verticiella sp. GG226]